MRKMFFLFLCAVVSSHGFTKELERSEFQKIIEELHELYAPEVRQLGKKLIFDFRWDSERENAGATRDDDNNPIIIMHGGMARHPLMTLDAFRLVLCHELGHFLGGAPKALRGNSGKLSWSSVEGQADYFATSKCLKRLFEDESANEEALRQHEKEISRHDSCNDLRCERILRASRSAALLYASIRVGNMDISLQRKDSSIVYKTKSGHPSSQCRLDTMAAGNFCDASPYSEFDRFDPKIGSCHRQQEEHNGVRPLCWFFPDEPRFVNPPEDFRY